MTIKKIYAQKSSEYPDFEKEGDCVRWQNKNLERSCKPEQWAESNGMNFNRDKCEDSKWV